MILFDHDKDVAELRDLRITNCGEEQKDDESQGRLSHAVASLLPSIPGGGVDSIHARAKLLQITKARNALGHWYIRQAELGRLLPDRKLPTFGSPRHVDG